MWTFISLGSIGLLFVLVMAQRSLSWAVPGYDGLAPGLLLLAALSYLPGLWDSIHEGEISVPPQTVRRYQKPALFWTVVTIHVVLTVAAALGSGAALLRWLG